jgi:hypothetical protein
MALDALALAVVEIGVPPRLMQKYALGVWQRFATKRAVAALKRAPRRPLRRPRPIEGQRSRTCLAGEVPPETSLARMGDRPGPRLRLVQGRRIVHG